MCGGVEGLWRVPGGNGGAAGCVKRGWLKRTMRTFGPYTELRSRMRALCMVQMRMTPTQSAARVNCGRTEKSPRKRPRVVSTDEESSSLRGVGGGSI